MTTTDLCVDMLRESQRKHMWFKHFWLLNYCFVHEIHLSNNKRIYLMVAVKAIEMFMFFFSSDIDKSFHEY